MAVRKMNAIIGGSTTWTRNIIHCMIHPTPWPNALVVHTSTADENGSIADSSANASPTGMSRNASSGKIHAAPAPVIENQ